MSPLKPGALLSFLSVCLAAGAANAQPCVPPASGLTHHWAGSGNGVDSIGGLPVSVEGGTSFAAGRVGQAFSFDGTGGHLSVSQAAGGSLDALTGLSLDAWIRPHRYPAGSGRYGIVTRFSTASAGGYGFYLASNARIVGQVSTGGVNRALQNGHNIPLNSFTHVALTYDGSNLRLYFNGTLSGAVQVSGPLDPSALRFMVGGRDETGTATDFFDGEIDEPAFHRRALTQAEVQAIVAAGATGRCLVPCSDDADCAAEQRCGGAICQLKARCPDRVIEGDESCDDGNGNNGDGCNSTCSLEQSCSTPPPGLRGWWPMDGSATDLAGGAGGSFEGGATTASGQVSSSLMLDGTDDHFAVPDAAALNPQTGVTVDAWIQPNRYPAGSGRYGIVTKYGDADTRGYGFYLAANARLVSVVTTGGVRRALQNSHNVPLQVWTHVAMTYDGRNMRLYFNGVASGGVQVSGPIEGSPLRLMVGGRDIDGSAGDFFNGFIDEARVHDRALTASQIAAIFAARNSGQCKSACSADADCAADQRCAGAVCVEVSSCGDGVAEGPESCDDGNGNDGDGCDSSCLLEDACAAPSPRLVSSWPVDLDATDGVGGNDGSIEGGAVLSTGKVGDALMLDGDDDHFAVPDDPSLDLRRGVTLAAWIHPNRYPAGAGRYGIVTKYDGTSGYGFYLASNARILAQVGTSGVARALQNSHNVPLQVWTHVAMSYDGSNLRLYFNGASSGAVQVSGAIDTNDLRVLFGGRDLGASTGDHFNGLLDEGQVYDHALSADEIAALASARNAGLCKLSCSQDSDCPAAQSCSGRSCRRAQLCGDEVIEGSERCDESNVNDGDGCSSSCDLEDACITPAPGLRGWWPLDGDAGDLAATHDGVLAGGSIFRDGRVEGAVVLDGVDDRVEVPDADGLDPTIGLSLSAWIKPNRYPAGAGRYAVITKYADGNPTGYGFYLAANARIVGQVATGGLMRALQNSQSVPLQVWTHVAMTYDGSNLRLYFNGAASGAVQVSGAIAPNDLQLVLGGRDNDGTPGDFFNGFIDEAQLHDRALTAAQIQAMVAARHAGQCKVNCVADAECAAGERCGGRSCVAIASCGDGVVEGGEVCDDRNIASGDGCSASCGLEESCTPPTSGLRAWWSGDADGADIIDGQDATLAGGATIHEGRVGGAFMFDGVDDRVVVPDDDRLDLVTGVTLSAWIRPNRYPAGADRYGIVTRYSSSVPSGYGFYLNNQARIVGHVSTAGVLRALQNSHNVPLQTWSHVVMTYDGVNLRLYFNGQPSGAVQVSGVMDINDLKLMIGARDVDGVDGDFFNGFIDEAKVHSHALTAAEILSLFQARNAGACKDPCSADAECGAGQTCSGLHCFATQHCGNDVVEGSESCDERNLNDGDGCDASCALESQCSAPLPGTVAWWPADGDGAEIISGLDANVLGGTDFRNGHVGGAIALDGEDDALEVADAAALDLRSGVSLSAWLHPNRYPAGADRYAIITKYGPTSGYGFYLNNQARIVSLLGNGHVLGALQNSVNIPLQVWTHVVMTYDGINMRIYVNGAPAGAVQLSGAIQSNDLRLMVGARDNAGTVEDHFNGFLDEATVYDRALTAEEIAEDFALRSAGRCKVECSGAAGCNPGQVCSGHSCQLRQSCGDDRVEGSEECDGRDQLGSDGCSAVCTLEQACTVGALGLLSWWPADGDAVDISDGNGGVLEGGAAYVNGQVASGWLLDGVDDHVRVAHSPSLSFGTGFTVEGYIHPNRYPAGSGRFAIAGKYSNGTTGFGLYLAGNARLVGILGIGGAQRALQNSVNIPLQTFTHVALTYDGNVMRIYVNGTPSGATTVPGVMGANSLDLLLGGRDPGSGAVDHFNGILDELAVYERALTQPELEAIIGARHSGRCKDIDASGVRFARRTWVATPGVGATITTPVTVTNNDAVARTLTSLPITNFRPDIQVAYANSVSLPLQLDPQSSVQLDLELDVSAALGNQAEVTLGLSSDSDPPSDQSRLLIFIAEPGQAQRPDLVLRSSDISFAPLNPEPGEPVTLRATVRNDGTDNAANVDLRFDINGSEVGDAVVASLPLGGSETVEVTVNAPAEGFHIVQVTADPAGAIAELNEGNNSAAQILQSGQPVIGSGTIVVRASGALACRGGAVGVGGNARYLLDNGGGAVEFPVQGGAVSVRIVETSERFQGAHSDTAGNFAQGLRAPEVDGIYTLQVEVSDSSVVGSFNTLLEVRGECPPPGGGGGGGGGGPGGTPAPGSPPGTVEDVYVFSEDIRFIPTPNPSLGETITLAAFIHYFGEEERLQVPVSFFTHFPIGGVLVPLSVGETTVSFHGGGAGSPVLATLPWTNTAEGAYIAQVVAEPDFPQYTGNDAATRLIVVGDAPLASTVSLDPAPYDLLCPEDTVRARIELPAGLDVADIDFDGEGVFITSPWEVADTDGDGTRFLRADGSSAVFGDGDNDGTPDVEVSFDADAFRAALPSAGSEIEITVVGALNDGRAFTDTFVLPLLDADADGDGIGDACDGPPPLGCGSVITESLTLSEDLVLTGCSGHGLTIVGDDITIDGNGFSIITDATGGGDVALCADGNSGLRIENLGVEGGGGGTGISLLDCTGCTLNGVRVEGFQTGTVLTGSGGVVIGSVFEGNIGVGLQVGNGAGSAPGFSVSGVTFTENGVAFCSHGATGLSFAASNVFSGSQVDIRIIGGGGYALIGLVFSGAVGVQAEGGASDVTVSGCSYLNAVGVGVRLLATSGFVIFDCGFRGAVGVELDGSVDARIEACRFELGRGVIAVGVLRLVIVLNIFEDIIAGVRLSGTDCDIDRNRFTRMTDYAIQLGDDPALGGQSCAAQLTALESMAASGVPLVDGVDILGNTLEDNPLDLCGLNAANVRYANSNSSSGAGHAFICTQCSDLNLSDVVLDATVPVYIVGGRRVTLQRLRLSGGDALVTLGTQDLDVLDCEFSGPVTVSASGGSVLRNRFSVGLVLGHAAFGVSSLTVDGNELGAGIVALRLVNASSMNIGALNLFGGFEVAIEILGGGPLVLADLDLSAVTRSAIVTSGVVGLQILRVVAIGLQTALSLSGQQILVRDSDLSSATVASVRLADISDVQIVHNKIRFSQVGVLALQNVLQALLRDNSLLRSLLHAVQNDGGVSIDARQNFWGDPAGAGAVPGSVAGLVDAGAPLGVDPFNDAPEVVTLVTVDGSVFSPDAALISWNIPFDLNGDRLHFTVEVSSDLAFTSPATFVSGVDPSPFTPAMPAKESAGVATLDLSPSALNDGEYFCRITVSDPLASTGPSDVIRFRIDSTPPVVCGDDQVDAGEHCDPPGQVLPGGCDTGALGICAAGRRVCNADCGGETCEPRVSPQVEICGNGIDEDCDGVDLACNADPVPASTPWGRGVLILAFAAVGLFTLRRRGRA